MDAAMVYWDVVPMTSEGTALNGRCHGLNRSQREKVINEMFIIKSLTFCHAVKLFDRKKKQFDNKKKTMEIS